MREINAVRPNGYRAASLFAGCGGSSLGYRMSGFRMVYANEFIGPARDVYAANMRKWTDLDGRDIRDVTVADFNDRVGEIDVLDGSPPCASFSTAGRRSEFWGASHYYSDGTSQRTDDLFFEFARILDGNQPRAFVAENVSGLVKGVSKGYFKRILETLRGCGYTVEARLLNAKWLGVPQSRQRLIFIGFRNDLGTAPTFPVPLPYEYTLRDAQAGLPEPEWVDGKCIDPDTGERIDTADTPIGRDALRVRAGLESKYMNTSLSYPDRPVATVTAAGGNRGAASVVMIDRKFTIAELRRICGFPDDFRMSGSYRQQWERLGRAVPPPVMAAVSASVQRTLDGL